MEVHKIKKTVISTIGEVLKKSAERVPQITNRVMKKKSSKQKFKFRTD